MDELDPVTSEQVAEFHRRLERNARLFQKAAVLIAAKHLVRASVNTALVDQPAQGVRTRLRRWMSQKVKKRKTPKLPERDRPKIIIIDAKRK